MLKWMHGKGFSVEKGLRNPHFLACTSQIWWRRRDSNLRPRAYESPALPLSYAAMLALPHWSVAEKTAIGQCVRRSPLKRKGPPKRARTW
jgi:hypothetical protein